MSALTGKALKFFPSERLQTFLEPTVWHHMTPLAQKHNAINLGQGFPGFSPPDFVKNALVDTVNERNGLDYMANQYARSAGNLKLVNTLAKRYSKLLSRDIDPLREVIICNGATGVIYNATEAFLNPGDEVITFEPTFDIYTAQTVMAGGKINSVPLKLRKDQEQNTKWYFDSTELRNAFNENTRLLILNTPHNPTGKVFTIEELQQIAEIVREYPNVVVLSDEVYEHLLYEDKQHINFASLPDMWDRTLTISSAGKTFTVTGWKVGWAVGPQHLIRAMEVVGSWVSFSVNTPSQIAIATCLEKAEEEFEGFPTFYDYLRNEYSRKKSILKTGLEKTGLKVIDSEGSFFLMVDTSNVSIPQQYLQQYEKQGRDWAFACWLTSEIGVCAIPPSPFYSASNKSLAHNLVRFAFAQKDDVLYNALERIQKIQKYIQ